MIVDEQVFADGYLPKRLLHREAEVEVLAGAFEPTLDGDQPDDVLIHGPHGVGKTVLTRHTFGRLEQRADVEWAHVRTMGLSTAGVIRATLQALGEDPAQNTPQEDLCLELRERVDKPTIVVLDEGDDLSSDALARLADVQLLAFVPIVHEPERLLSRVDDDRVRHRLVGRELELDRYASRELADILEPRVRHGLRTSVDDEFLEEIADHVGGVARKGIQTLRAAAEIAAERQCRIEAVGVDAAHERAMTWIREANLQSLTLHHHVLYEIVRDAGAIEPDELHDRYDDVATAVYADREQTPIGRRSRRNKLRKLATYELVVVDGANRHRTYRAADNTVESPIQYDVLQATG